MATYTELPSGRVRAQIKLTRPLPSGKKSISESFDTRRAAEQWAKRTEVALEGGAAPAAAAGAQLKVHEVVTAYRTMRQQMGTPIDPQSNAEYILRHISEDLGDELVGDLKPPRFVQWARLRAEDGANPATFNMEFSLLGTVLRHTAGWLDVVFPDVIGAARPMLNYAELIGAANRRERTPNLDEQERVIAWVEAEPRFGKRVADAIRVSRIAGLRRGELCRISHKALDPQARAVLVTKRKHPRRRMMRDEWVPLFGEAWDIVNAQPPIEGDDRIFPVSREKMTDSVTEAARALGIPDLHLHDFRHVANDSMRNLGFSREERKAVMGHLSDKVHDVYTHVKPEELQAKYAELQGTKQRQPRPRKARARPASETRTHPSPSDS